MFDRYNRRINYLRISVTDRCNLRCQYCMPEDGVSLLNHKDILSFEEIAEVVRFGVAQGVDKVRITGGEPLVRKGIVNLVKILSEINGIKDLAMTTNGVYLSDYAEDLKKAGLMRINISLDTIDPQKYNKVTRGGDIQKVFDGIKAAKKYNLTPVKINCVVLKSSNEEDAQEVKHFCEKNDLSVRFIHRMDLQTGEFSIVEGGDGGDCSICNRLRLTADGKLKPCLFSNIEWDIRKLGVERAFQEALYSKPSCGSKSTNRNFSNIGG